MIKHCLSLCNSRDRGIYGLVETCYISRLCDILARIVCPWFTSKDVQCCHAACLQASTGLSYSSLPNICFWHSPTIVSHSIYSKMWLTAVLMIFTFAAQAAHIPVGLGVFKKHQDIKHGLAERGIVTINVAAPTAGKRPLASTTSSMSSAAISILSSGASVANKSRTVLAFGGTQTQTQTTTAGVQPTTSITQQRSNNPNEDSNGQDAIGWAYAHNSFRNQYGAKDVTWSYNLSVKASNNAKKCDQKHSWVMTALFWTAIDHGVMQLRTLPGRVGVHGHQSMWSHIGWQNHVSLPWLCGTCKSLYWLSSWLQLECTGIYRYPFYTWESFATLTLCRRDWSFHPSGLESMLQYQSQQSMLLMSSEHR